MSIITAVLTPSPDGTLHLPLPAEWRQREIKVTVQMEPVDGVSGGGEPSSAGLLRGFGCLRGKIKMAPDFDAPLEDFKNYME